MFAGRLYVLVTKLLLLLLLLLLLSSLSSSSSSSRHDHHHEMKFRVFRTIHVKQTMPLRYILFRCSRIVPAQRALTSWSQLNCPSLLCFQFRCLSPCSLRCKRGLVYKRHFGFVLFSVDSRTAVVTMSVADCEMVLADGRWVRL